VRFRPRATRGCWFIWEKRSARRRTSGGAVAAPPAARTACVDTEYPACVLFPADYVLTLHSGPRRSSGKLSEYESRADKMPAGKARWWKCRCYGGSLAGPGGRGASEESAEKVVAAAHRANVSCVFFGISPGFASWAIWRKSFAAPRLQTRGRKWLRGSVGIADGKRGVSVRDAGWLAIDWKDALEIFGRTRADG